MTPSSQLIASLERNIAENNNLIAMAQHVKDPKERVYLLDRLHDMIVKTQSILNDNNNRNNPGSSSGSGRS